VANTLAYFGTEFITAVKSFFLGELLCSIGAKTIKLDEPNYFIKLFELLLLLGIRVVIFILVCLSKHPRSTLVFP